MSHFTNLKTSFKNLLHLENALNKLEIPYKREKKVIESKNSKLYNIYDVIVNNYVIIHSNRIGFITMYYTKRLFYSIGRALIQDTRF